MACAVYGGAGESASDRGGIVLLLLFSLEMALALVVELPDPLGTFTFARSSALCGAGARMNGCGCGGCVYAVLDVPPALEVLDGEKGSMSCGLFGLATWKLSLVLSPSPGGEIRVS